MMMKSIFKRSKQLAVIVLAVIVTIFVLGAFDARRMPGLELWHTAELKSEFTADESKSNITFQTYLENEERLFQELQRKISDNAPNKAEYPLRRYFPNGLNNPETFPKNWNRSFERIPPEIRGGAILLHGLTDSPYSLRKAAEILVSQHIYVLGLRLPGHGTIPAGIDAVRWQDWRAAVHIGVRQVIHQTGDQKPFFMVGYSNGAALAIKYTLDALEDASLVVPDQLVLFSPAVAITPLAVFADWHKFISFVPFFEKFKWTAIELEYDPYKYISFPKNAGKQTYLLTRAVQRQIKTLKQEGKLSRFPPSLTFQSLVDGTVRTSGVTEVFYDNLHQPNHELVFFDINRSAVIKSFLKSDHSEIIQRLEEKDQLPYDLTIVTNVSDDSPEVIARTRKSATSEITEIPLGLRWPTGIFSLSHIAIPFSPDDLIYGRISRSSPESGMNLGTLEPRGERGVLRVSLSHFMRLRYNPFFPYIEKRMVENIRRHTAKGDS
jgi:alpha-beta hydrolase superfamily lysophospholipase